MAFSVDTLFLAAYDAVLSYQLRLTAAYPEPILTRLHVEGLVEHDPPREEESSHAGNGLHE